ncbi:MAG: hypothetical protein OHK0039_04760 [Bacteroidia bacterium]
MNYLTSLLLLLCLALPGWAQPTAIYVGTKPLAEIEGPYIEVRFARIDGQWQAIVTSETHCGPGVSGVTERLCSGLFEPAGKPLLFEHYTDGLSLLDSLGWKLKASWYTGGGDGFITARSLRFLLYKE